MCTDTGRRREEDTSAETRREERSEQLPTWRNTRPRGNQEPDLQDVERSEERLEALLGR